MTWTYFTANLDGSRPIKKAERDELYTNLDLQLAACSDNFSLNATDQTDITGSNLLTDLASLDDSSGPTNTLDRLHDILQAASAIWPNYATAVSDALTAESITSANRDSILAAAVDDYRLWNYYRRVIDALVCCTMTTKNETGGEVDGPGVDEFPYDVTGLFVAAHDVELLFTIQFPDGYAKIEVQADTVEIYDSGCINTSVNPTIEIPAGTEEIKVIVTRECSGAWAENGWEFTLSCA